MMNETLCCEHFKEFFVNDETHQEYLAVASPLGPLSLSYMVEKKGDAFVCRVILRTNEFVKFFLLTPPPPEKKLFSKPKSPSIKDALKMCVLTDVVSPLSDSNLKTLYPHLKV